MSRAENRPDGEKHLRQSRSRDPSPLAWSIATISLALPWVAAGLAGFGAWQLAVEHETTSGLAWIVAGALVLALDVVIDVVWAHPSVLPTDEPLLNNRCAQYAGRTGLVVEPIRNGRGRVRIGDTTWLATGPDSAAGTMVRVEAASKSELSVIPLEQSSNEVRAP